MSLLERESSNDLNSLISEHRDNPQIFWEDADTLSELEELYNGNEANYLDNYDESDML